MPTLTDASKTAQEQILSAVKQSQKAVVDAVAAWAKAVEKAAPSVPSLPAIPGNTELPRPEQVVDTAFDFAQKLLDSQRAFARDVLKAVQPITPQTGTKKSKSAVAA
jgi:hypothetical protein